MLQIYISHSSFRKWLQVGALSCHEADRTAILVGRCAPHLAAFFALLIVKL